MTTRKPWTDAENWSICSLYAMMSLRAVNGMKYNKAAMIREVQGTDENPGPLHDRSRGSIEAKLMNLTAVLRDLGLTEYSMERHGYKALPNYQRALKEQAQRYWHEQLRARAEIEEQRA